MKRFLIYGHSGAYNHGAEALVKTTIARIRAKHADAEILLSSHFPAQDRECGIEADALIGPDPDAWEQEKCALAAEDKTALARQMYAAALQEITPDTTLLSVGGDNYCYNNWHRLAVFQERAGQQGAKSILWGASIEPSAITAEMTAVLNTHTHILVRESITFQALRENGVTTNVHLIPDIAFTLPPQEVSLPFSSGYVAINISPLVVRKEKEPEILYQSVQNLIDHILTATGLNIALVPHVTVKADNDCEALQNVFERLSAHQRARVRVIGGNLSASEYKYILAHCEVLVCARTHASIAAYSSCVPTLVLGYSVKSAGIAADLGISETVLPVDSIQDPHLLTEHFKELYSQKIQYREHFLKNMPHYVARAEEYSNFL